MLIIVKSIRKKLKNVQKRIYLDSRLRENDKKQSLKSVIPRLDQRIQVVGNFNTKDIIFYLFFFLRYSFIKLSILPLRTESTSPISTPVLWSFTSL